MQSLLTLILILTPLFIGYLIPFPKQVNDYADKALGYLVYIILFYIGLELSQIDGLTTQFPIIIKQVLILAAITIGSGLVGVAVLDVYQPVTHKCTQQKPNQNISILGSFSQLLSVFVGFACGHFFADYTLVNLLMHEHAMTVMLMILIFLVGVTLTNGSDISLKEMLLNKRGVQISIVFIMSVWFGGLVYAMIMPNVSVWQGLALVSGFGWYSLSGIVMTEAYGAVWGSTALLNDLIREFIAIMFIPRVMRMFPSSAVAMGGATSLDFTLPVIQQSGGNTIVPTAISFGFIINIVSPVVMVVFSSLG